MNRFSIYDSEEMSTLKLIEKLSKQIDDLETVNYDVEIAEARKGYDTLEKKIDAMDNEIKRVSENGAMPYQGYRYISTTFRNDDMQLFVNFSNDGKNWTTLNKNGCFRPSTKNKTLRDPSLLRIDEYWYITYTRIDWGTGNYIGFCRTKDFWHYEELADIGFTGFQKVWAPEFFFNYSDSTCWIIFNGSIDGTTFKTYYQQVWIHDGIVEKVGDYGAFHGDVLNDMNTIDGSIYQDNNRFYLIVKNESNKTNAIFESFNFFNGYQLIKKDLFPNCEGCQIIKINNGFRIYMDNYEDSTKGLGYCDTFDWFNSFTPFDKLIDPVGGEHNYVIDLAPQEKNRVSDKAFISCGCSYNYPIPNGQDTLLKLDEVVVKADMAIDLDSEKRVIIPSDGVYVISAYVVWDWDGTDTSERVTEISVWSQDRGDLRIGKIQDHNFSGTQYGQAVTVTAYLRYNDLVGVNLYNGGGATKYIVKKENVPQLTITKIS